jgi:hypothetical protein
MADTHLGVLVRLVLPFGIAFEFMSRGAGLEPASVVTSDEVPPPARLDIQSPKAGAHIVRTMNARRFRARGDEILNELYMKKRETPQKTRGQVSRRQAVSLLEFLAKSTSDHEANGCFASVWPAPNVVIIRSLEVPTLDPIDDSEASQGVNASSVAGAGEDVVHLTLLS